MTTAATPLPRPAANAGSMTGEPRREVPAREGITCGRRVDHTIDAPGVSFQLHASCRHEARADAEMRPRIHRLSGQRRRNRGPHADADLGMLASHDPGALP